MKPFVVTTSDTVADFFKMSLNQSVYDVANRLEAYCLSGVKGEITICAQYHSTNSQAHQVSFKTINNKY